MNHAGEYARDEFERHAAGENGRTSARGCRTDGNLTLTGGSPPGCGCRTRVVTTA